MTAEHMIGIYVVIEETMQTVGHTSHHGYPQSQRTATATATSSPSATPSPSPTPCPASGTAPYLHTCGSQIVDATGTPVRLRAANWYGFESNDFVATGLHDWSYKTIIARLKSQGFNALRIPFSNELVERNPIVSTLSAICMPFADDPTTTPRSCVPIPGTTNTPITGSYGSSARHRRPRGASGRRRPAPPPRPSAGRRGPARSDSGARRS